MNVKRIADAEGKFSRKQILVWRTMLFVGAGALALTIMRGDGLKTSDIGSDFCSSEGARELVDKFLSAYSTGSSSASLYAAIPSHVLAKAVADMDLGVEIPYETFD